jgi:hypothetical protein
MNPRANRVPPSSTIGNGGLPTNPFTGYYNNVMQSPKTSMFTNMKDAIVPAPKTPPVFASPNTTASPITQFNQIDEIFKCFICFEKAVEPHLCPFCSKIVCYACIKVISFVVLTLLEMVRRSKKEYLSSLSIQSNTQTNGQLSIC